MTRHCMLDLETLGKRPGCTILSIGACVFTETGLEPGADFHAYLELSTQTKYSGAHIDADTVLWWLGQGEAARAAQCQSPRLPVGRVLLDFKEWFYSNKVDTVWSNGADFDIPILTALFEACGASVPWKYNAGRCVRTIFQLVGKKPGAFGTVNPLAHDALADAKFQAAETAAAMRWLGNQRAGAAKPVLRCCNCNMSHEPGACTSDRRSVPRYEDQPGAGGRTEHSVIMAAIGHPGE